MSEQSAATMKLSRGPSINQLPCELLASIFVLVHSDARASSGGTGARNCLAFVCRLWHEVALSTPELWSYVSLSSPLERLTARLALSKQTPLDVAIDANWSSFGVEAVNQSLELLKENWIRLRSLQVTLLDPYCIRAAVEAFNHAAMVHPHCVLEEIQINVNLFEGYPQFSHNYGGDGVSYLSLPNSQRLRRVDLRGLNPHPMLLSPTDTLSGLRELVLESATSRFLNELLPTFLSLTPNLTSLSIRKYVLAFFEETMPDTHNISSISKISLPKLESLDLDNVDSGFIYRISDIFDISNLRSLSIHNCGPVIIWAMIEHCVGLRRLSLKGFSQTDTPYWLETLDDLEQLEVYSCDRFQEVSFASKMVERLNESACCAKLKSLDMHPDDDLYMINRLREFQQARPSVLLGGTFSSIVEPPVHGH